MIEVRQITSREEWLEWRRPLLTASDVGAVAGVDDYRTPLSVYASKISGFEQDENFMMFRGRMYEDAGIAWMRNNHPTWTIEKASSFYVDVDLRLGCTPDALARDETGRKINIQVKTVASPIFEGWLGKPPQSYILQTVCENMLTNADEGILAVLVTSTYGGAVHEFEVPRHQAAERRIGEISREFWANVDAGVVPAPNYELDRELILKAYPPSRPEPVSFDHNNRIREVLSERAGLKQQHKVVVKEAEALERQVKALDTEIIHILEGAEIATVDNWKIYNKTIHRKEYTVPASSYPMLRVYGGDTESEEEAA